ncbi:hypothetical protein GHT06_022256 [Daphnia sinensis]|uniref:Uncharacterized protein n=1 Tax=Daphnia sinensis TaxID=1820382 RepID=A0AAD5KH97_9CRUS|nr:hypothetical protein GHT06_022256 [Daphnia sinensis]
MMSIKLTMVLLFLAAMMVCCYASGKIPFPYYQRPPYRYPYYDNSGKGHLYYGYGDSKLYTYNKFTPLEGIYRR